MHEFLVRGEELRGNHLWLINQENSKESELSAWNASVFLRSQWNSA